MHQTESSPEYWTVKVFQNCTCKSSIVCSILCIFCCAHVTDIRFGYDWISLSQSVHHIKKEVSGQIISYSYQYDSNQHSSATVKCLTICTPPQSSLETVIVYFKGNVPYCTKVGIFRFYAIISHQNVKAWKNDGMFSCAQTKISVLATTCKPDMRIVSRHHPKL